MKKNLKCVVSLKNDEGKILPQRYGIVEKENEDGTYFVKQYAGSFEDGNYKIEELIKRFEVLCNHH